MRRIPDAPGTPSPGSPGSSIVTSLAEAAAGAARATPFGSDALGLDSLAKTLDQAALNISRVALDGAEQAALSPDTRAAADAARDLADQITGQVKALEVALSLVVPTVRR